MSDAQYCATETELRRLTLGGRPERPELLVDVDVLAAIEEVAGRADVELRRITRPIPQDRIRRRRV